MKNRYPSSILYAVLALQAGCLLFFIWGYRDFCGRLESLLEIESSLRRDIVQLNRRLIFIEASPKWILLADQLKDIRSSLDNIFEIENSRKYCSQSSDNPVEIMINLWLANAEYALVEKDYKTVFHWLEKILSLEPRNPEALSLKAFALLEENPYDRTLYQEVLQLTDQAHLYDKGNALAYFVKGRVFELTKESEKAELQYIKSLSLDPDNEEALYRMVSLLKRDQPEKALTYLNSLILNSPHREEYNVERAKLLFSLERYSEALNQLKSHSLFRSEPVILELTSLIYRKQMDKTREKESLILLAGTGAIKPLMELRLAYLCYGDGDYSQAENHFRRLLDEESLDSSLKQDISEKLMSLLMERGKSLDVLTLFHSYSGVKTSPMIFNYAEALLDTGSYAEALQQLNILKKRQFKEESVSLMLKKTREQMQ